MLAEILRSIRKALQYALRPSLLLFGLRNLGTLEPVSDMKIVLVQVWY